MSLQLLLNENMSHVIAEQIRHHRPNLMIESVHTWRGGEFRGRHDRPLLQAARDEGLTLVTYDQKTIPPLLVELYSEGESHAGIIFVDDQTIPSNDFGTLTRALIFLWERFGDEDWQDHIRFVEKPR
jgi:hypothetical protein